MKMTVLSVASGDDHDHARAMRVVENAIGQSD